MIHHYIISGVDLTRESYLKCEFKKWDLNEKDITWIKGNNKNDLSQELINKICTNKNLKKGQISCTYKHYLALKDMIERERPYAIIMEDDVNFKNNIQEMLQLYIEELDRDHERWDVLFDGDIEEKFCERCRYHEEQVIPERKIYHKSHKNEAYYGGLMGSTRGANYYLLTLKAAKQIYENFLPFDNIVDHYYNCLFRKLNLNVYWSMPPFVHKMNRKSTLQFD